MDEFERVFAELCGVPFGIGVGSGTDALFLALKAVGVEPGDEVITTPFTFYATISAIIRNGAKPVFADIGDDYNIDAHQIESVITDKTKAILPVHWSGNPCDVEHIQQIAKTHGLAVVADACHAINAEFKGRPIGQFADASCFSMHPLKNLNVWGDGGAVVTESDSIMDQIMLLRNHGLSDRDTCKVFAYNSRLDSLQAIVALHLIKHQLPNTTQGRINNAQMLIKGFNNRSEITLPVYDPDKKHVFHLFMGEFERRDELKDYLNLAGIDAKIHYPTPMHLQPAAAHLGYGQGDFPRAERLANACLSFPVHEFLDESKINQMIELTHQFYQRL